MPELKDVLRFYLGTEVLYKFPKWEHWNKGTLNANLYGHFEAGSVEIILLLKTKQDFSQEQWTTMQGHPDDRMWLVRAFKASFDMLDLLETTSAVHYTEEKKYTRRMPTVAPDKREPEKKVLCRHCRTEVPPDRWDIGCCQSCHYVPQRPSNISQG